MKRIIACFGATVFLVGLLAGYASLEKLNDLAQRHLLVGASVLMFLIALIVALIVALRTEGR